MKFIVKGQVWAPENPESKTRFEVLCPPNLDGNLKVQDEATGAVVNVHRKFFDDKRLVAEKAAVGHDA